MRSDMHELLVVRPRKGSHWPNGAVRAARAAERAARSHDDWDALPRPQGRPGVGPRKCLNENLAPLTRFLSRQVGRPWDAVFSELRAQLDMRSPIQLHIMEHLFQFVAVQVEQRLDGRWHRTTGWAGGWPVRTDGRHFYVDPRSGLLMRPRPAPMVKPQRPDHHTDAAGHVYARVGGIWWQVGLEVVSRWPPPGVDRVDVLLGVRVGPDNAALRDALYGDPTRYAICRRPLSRRALKALNLWRK